MIISFLALTLPRLRRVVKFCVLNVRAAELFADNLARNLAKRTWKAENLSPNIVGLSFHDNAKCNFLTNVFTLSGSASSASSTGCPLPVAMYRQHEVHVDTVGAEVNQYLNHHRHRKWTHACLIHLVRIAQINTWKLYCLLTGARPGQKEFIESLMIQMLSRARVNV